MYLEITVHHLIALVTNYGCTQNPAVHLDVLTYNENTPRFYHQFGAKMTFPTVTGSNLLREKQRVPQDFKGRLNLVFIAFQQWQQMEVDSWMPTASELEAQFNDLRYYELPTLDKRDFLYRLFLNEGMRAGIPNAKARQRTITLYLDKTAFRRTLEMPEEQHIYILLLDQQGNEFFRARSSYQPEHETALRVVLTKLLSQ